ERGTDHAQSGTQDAHIGIARDGGNARVIPGVDHARAWMQQERRQRARRVADREYHVPGLQARARSQVHGESVAVVLDGAGAIAQVYRRFVRGQGGEGVAQVACVVAASGEAVGKRGPGRVAVAREEVDEVVGLPADRTHARGDYVQQVLGPGG